MAGKRAGAALEAKADKFERLRAEAHITGVSALLPNFRPKAPSTSNQQNKGAGPGDTSDCVSPLKGATWIEALDAWWPGA